MTEATRYVHGFINVARFLFGGPLVALPAEHVPVNDDPPFVVRLLTALLLIAFIIGGLIAFAFVARTFGFDEIIH